MDERVERLRCVSVHSVKGGVGKSTLSYALARALAREEPTLLVDMDLTGTSLADVLPLECPTWAGVPTLVRQPTGFAPWPEARAMVDARVQSPEGRTPPFLNDFLLWGAERDDRAQDVHPEALCWRVDADAGAPASLRVIPSSALPRDLSRILPIIYDELHAGYLEGRLEWLLESLITHTRIRTVVFDTPPTIPGLSRSLLSMAMRLPRGQDLAEEGGTPPELHRLMQRGAISWTPILVVTADHQDLRAADRWLVDRADDERDAIRVALNRAGEEREVLLPRLRAALQHGEEDAAGIAGLQTLQESDYVRPLLGVQREHTHLALVVEQRELALFRPSRDRRPKGEPDLTELLSLIREPGT